jgi:hypothetical protein
MGVWNVYPMTNDDALDVIDEINKKVKKQMHLIKLVKF